jgi:hypothetical protein
MRNFVSCPLFVVRCIKELNAIGHKENSGNSIKYGVPGIADIMPCQKQLFLMENPGFKMCTLRKCV